MQRRTFIRNTGLLAGASALFQQNIIAQLFKTQQSNIRMLRENVGIFTEKGGTIGFALTGEGIITVDAQFPDTVAHYMEEARKRNIMPFQFLLNTHHHGDHTAGNIAFKGKVEQVIAHENSLVNQRNAAEKAGTLEKQLLPTVTFRTDTKVKLGKEKIKGSYHGPAHTNGDALYHFEEANITHLGDLMFNKRHPFVDRSAGASIGNWINVLGKAMKEYNKKTLYIFGHSLNPGEETGSEEDLKKFQDYLSKLLRFAETELRRGVSKEEFIRNTSIPGVTEWSGPGIDRPLTAAYEEITEKKA
jgi:cyclase